MNWPNGGKNTTVMPAACQGSLILIDGGYERASTIGFRCAVSTGPTPPQPPQPPPLPPPPSPPGPQPSPGGPLPFQQKAVGYSWKGGTPEVVGTDEHSGVYADEGTFELKVTSSGSAPHVLRLWAGAFCKAATLTAVAGKQTASKTLPRWKPEPTPCDHSNGTLNIMWEVTFTGDLTLTWKVRTQAIRRCVWCLNI